MTDTPIEFIVAAFQDERAAGDTLKMLKQARREKLIGIQRAAVLRRDSKGKLHIKEATDISGKRGMLGGGVVGAVVGVMAGPILLPTAVGALLGGLATKLRDTGFSDRRLREMGEALQPGTSAIIAVIEHRWVAEIEQMLAEAGAQLITEAITADIAAQLETGNEVAYTVLETTEGLLASRMAGGEDEIEIAGIVVTEEGVVAAKAQISIETAGEEIIEGEATEVEPNKADEPKQ
ncbi:DUF1269 domain-containing protein [Candidatus Chloroploca asiatica]|uniref:DUF1269 domain-containing protein n=1 Tax=Candidatus Chloroploca asiatica TaxID=1506545 RepID=A0A2H3KYC3_9CHLR|nr:DUF1269 domain-containing protein [Candidatus Chloroploca asiatica]PDV97361.1 hypothetical protein A9Q02_18820 [Candidatus Chloroploca asiatica]